MTQNEQGTQNNQNEQNTQSAIESVEGCLDELNKAKTKLDEAIQSAEKEQNKSLIQNSLKSVDQSINNVQYTINNYKESSK